VTKEGGLYDRGQEPQIHGPPRGVVRAATLVSELVSRLVDVSQVWCRSQFRVLPKHLHRLDRVAAVYESAQENNRSGLCDMGPLKPAGLVGS